MITIWIQLGITRFPESLAKSGAPSDACAGPEADEVSCKAIYKGNVEGQNTDDLHDNHDEEEMDIDSLDKVDYLEQETRIRYEWEASRLGNPDKILLLLPTASQLPDTSLLACAWKLGVTTSMGVFKI